MRLIKYIGLILILLSGCVPAGEVQRNTSVEASMYNPSEYSLNAEYQLFHLSDDMTSLYIRLFPGELLFNQANDEGEYRAMVRIDYIIYELNDKGEYIQTYDSSAFIVKLGRADQENSAYFTSKVLKIDSGSRYMIRLIAKDMQRGTTGMRHLFIEKKNILSAQNYSIVSARSGYPRFNNYLKQGEIFRIRYRELGYDSIYMDFYRTVHEYPKPPVTLTSMTDFLKEPDQTLVLPYSDTMIYTLSDVGTYHFRMDNATSEGITLHNFGEDFPQVKSEEDLAGPLFYVATLTEYKKIKNASNLKLAVDDFWLQRNPSTDRARELIRVYYSRVLYANLYFTAEREGWKTDQGMVFILFGPPDRMQDSGREQRWYYISRKQNKVIEFIFDRDPGAFSNNVLVWRKNIESMQYWSTAVSSWRSGKVFSLGR